MRLAISNIAWEQNDELSVAERLAELEVTAVEIAPTKVFSVPEDVTDDDLDDYARSWARHGIRIVAMQSLLFGAAGADLFGDHDGRRRLVARVSAMTRVGGRLGVDALVFGSPTNRRVPEGMSAHTASAIAVDVFGRLGDEAHRNGTMLCIEPNPPAYGCNFVTTAAQGRELVSAVGSPGFGLHLDAAGMTLAGDDPATEILATGSRLRHFHISAPQLGELSDDVDHVGAATALEEVRYPATISIEMRSDAAVPALDRVTRAVRFARANYPQAL